MMLCGWEGNHRSDIILATDFSDLTTYGLMAYERQMSTPPMLHWEYGNLYLLYGTVEHRVWDEVRWMTAKVAQGHSIGHISFHVSGRQ